MTRVLLIEDDGRYRDTLATLFSVTDGFQLVDAYPAAEPALDHARRALAADTRPWDVAVVDMNLPGMHGVEAIAALKAIFSELPILVLTVYEDPATVLRAVTAGADGYLLKHTHPRVLIEHLELILTGGAPLTPGVAATLLDLVRVHAPSPAGPPLELSRREGEVLQCLVDGLSYKQIAAELGIGIETVRSHIRRLYRKLQVHSVAEAVSRALREGLVR